MNMKNTDQRENIYDDSYEGDYEYNYENEYECDDKDLYEYNETHESLNNHKKKKKRIFLKIIGIIIMIFISIIIFLLAFGWISSLTVPEETNFLIMGTDQEGSRTDTLMFCTYNKENGKISIISIPRDTYVTVDDETYEKMRESYPEPGSKSMKINTVHHFGGEEYGVEMIVDQVEVLMGRNVDFYAKIDFDMFRYIIDSVGGIEFYVPQDMKYCDPYQNLNIDLKEGLQTLDGEMAEQLVRYRSGYANADLGRVDVQQQFMKAFISQTLSKGKILSNPGVYFNVLFKYNYVETNAGLFDALSYAFLLGGIDTDNIETQTLPGNPSYKSGQSVYIADESAIKELFE
ncbi:MAG: LytR family transcriptional regulator [Ruminococcaceae bacterium]|nr:LytR family transcriptional regulator [Oscillospiraceae bacterium]